MKEANACALEELAKTERLLLITSTWGEGDPPDNAAQLLAALNAANAIKLEKLSYSVLALGDKNYSDFCGAGRKFDEAFEKLGRHASPPALDCDLDYEAPAKTWADAVLAKLLECGDSSAPALSCRRVANRADRSRRKTILANKPVPRALAR